MSDVTFTLTVNGKEISPSEKTLRVLSAIAATDNPGSETVKKAVEIAGGQAYLDSFAKNGNPDDMFVIVKSSGKEIRTGKGTREILAKRMTLALTAETWQTQITVETVGKEAKPDKSGEVVDVV